MNLAIDIGNSFTHLAVYSGNRSIYTDSFRNVLPQKYGYALRRSFRNVSALISAVGISSVVPNVTGLCFNEAKKEFKLIPLIINYNKRLSVKIKIKNPLTLGPDRICNAVFGYEYFKRKHNVIIADFGTANTYDAVLKNGSFIGGIIAPGIMTSSEALRSKTGKLPLLRVDSLKFGKSVIGKNTEQAIASGLLNYPLFSTNSIISSIEKEFKSKFKVILTGGSGELIQKRLTHDSVYIKNTVLGGINYILNMQKPK